MAIVYDDTQMQQAQPTFSQRIGEHPYLALVIGLILAVGVGYVIYQLRGGASSSGTTSSTTTPTPGATGVNSAGQQVVYVPTSNTFLDYNNVSDSNNPVTNITNNPAPTPPPPPPAPIWNLSGASPSTTWNKPYVVQAGDTLDTIATKINALAKKDSHWKQVLNGKTISSADIYGMNKTNIDALNAEYGSSNGQQIYQGQSLWIPVELQD